MLKLGSLEFIGRDVISASLMGSGMLLWAGSFGIRLFLEFLSGFGWRDVVHHAGPFLTDEDPSYLKGQSDDLPNLPLESATSCLVSSLVPFNNEVGECGDIARHFFTFLGVRTIAYSLEGVESE